MMEEQIEKRLLELANRSYERGIYCYSHFLDLSAQTALKRIAGKLPPAGLTLFGGQTGCERVIACFGDPGMLGYEPDYPVTCLHAVSSGRQFAGKLTHRDFLGALMGLGIERELIGDIVVRENEAWIFCLKSIAPYLLDHFIQAGRNGLNVTETEAPPAGDLFRTRDETVQVSGERLDAVVAHAFRMSREDAQGLFAAGKVFVNGEECSKSSREPHSGDIVSVRGFGRFRYGGTVSTSKKGKLNVLVSMYI